MHFDLAKKIFITCAYSRQDSTLDTNSATFSILQCSTFEGDGGSIDSTSTSSSVLEPAPDIIEPAPEDRSNGSSLIVRLFLVAGIIALLPTVVSSSDSLNLFWACARADRALLPASVSRAGPRAGMGGKRAKLLRMGHAHRANNAPTSQKKLRS